MSTEPNDGWRNEVFPVTEFQDKDEWPSLEDKAFSSVKIRMNPVGKGRIWIDGVELKATLSIKLSASNNTLTIVTIEILASVDLGANVFTENLTIKEVSPDADDKSV